MNKKLKSEIGYMLFKERLEMRKEMDNKINSAKILIIRQTEKGGLTDYFSIRIEDAIKAIKDHLNINFERHPEECHAVKKNEKK